MRFSINVVPAYIVNDGKQTPMRGHPVFIAQHATATCCRECIRKWHKMQPGKELSQVQQGYLVDVIMTWIQQNIVLWSKRVDYIRQSTLGFNDLCNESARKNINIFFINSINKTIFEILKVLGTLRNLSL